MENRTLNKKFKEWESYGKSFQNVWNKKIILKLLFIISFIDI